jgi:hypothetical protein
MPSIHKPQSSARKFERYIHMYAVRAATRPLQQILRAGKPNQLAVKLEMHLDQPAIEFEKQILAMSPHTNYAAPLAELCKLRRCLRPRRNRMKRVYAPYPLPAHQRTKRSSYCFYFRKFRHEKGMSSSTWLQR